MDKARLGIILVSFFATHHISSAHHQIIRAGVTAALARWGMPALICIESLVL